MKWLLIIFFIVSVSSVNAGTLKDYENEIVNSCVEYTNTTSDRYYCIMSELYGWKQVLHIFRSKSTYSATQWKYFLTLLDKHKIGKTYDYVNIELEFKDYLNKGEKQ